jgi:peptidoglycan/xylan/chitin deacetylase (PgdA/CDA1 family)
MFTAALLAVALLLLSLSLRYGWWRPTADPRFPRILMYHMISPRRPGARFNKLRVSPAMFERQLRWLHEQGWRSFTVSELIEQGGLLPEKAFAVTFDDGYADNLERALPLLRRFNVRATLYLVVERFDRDWSVQRKAHHGGGELRREPKLSDAQVRELLGSGLFELGAHTLTHPDLTRLDAESCAREISESRRRLEAVFGVPVKSFAYPFGRYADRHVAQVGQAGFTSAVTTEEGIDDPDAWQPLRLKRVKIGGRDGWWFFRQRLRAGRRGWR